MKKLVTVIIRSYARNIKKPSQYQSMAEKVH
jgi:hypothetical protein